MINWGKRDRGQVTVLSALMLFCNADVTVMLFITN